MGSVIPTLSKSLDGMKVHWAGSLQLANQNSPYRGWPSCLIYKRQVCIQQKGPGEDAALEGCCRQ